MQTWRDRAQPVVSKAIRDGREIGLAGKDLRKFVQRFYPFEERYGWAYKVWLDELKRQLGDKNPLPENLSSFWRDYLASPEAVLPTLDEQEAKDRDVLERFEKIGKARAAIVSDCGGPWKKGKPSVIGATTCPACGGHLDYSRSGYNGHIHAKCKTPGCVSWME